MIPSRICGVWYVDFFEGLIRLPVEGYHFLFVLGDSLTHIVASYYRIATVRSDMRTFEHGCFPPCQVKAIRNTNDKEVGVEAMLRFDPSGIS